LIPSRHVGAVQVAAVEIPVRLLAVRTTEGWVACGCRPAAGGIVAGEIAGRVFVAISFAAGSSPTAPAVTVIAASVPVTTALGVICAAGTAATCRAGSAPFAGTTPRAATALASAPSFTSAPSFASTAGTTSRASTAATHATRERDRSGKRQE